MSLVAQIANDYKDAFKAKETLRVMVLRMLRAEIHNREKDKKAELTDAEVVGIVQSMIKKRREAAEAFLSGNATEKAEQERTEAGMLETYLPAPLDEAELDRLVYQAVEEAGAKGVADIGNVMKIVMPKVAGRADGKTINQKVRQALSH